ncbi:MAG: OB-fold domain-containing protein [bacterium]|nr:OB-fold domain-containing protein [bacterium]
MSEQAEAFVRRTGGEWWMPYWEAGRRRELRFQRCTDCGTWRHPPGPMCPSCQSFGVEWARASGRGTLLSWVVCHPPLLAVWKERAPYVVVLVQCEEGVRTMGNVLDLAAEDLRMDMPLVVDFAPSPDGDLVPQWRRA